MSGFIYFIKTDSKTVTDDLLTKHGLSCFAGGRVNEQRECSLKDGKGIVFSVHDKCEGVNVGYYEDRQKWMEFLTDEEFGFKVGYEKKPEPDDFLKQGWINGYKPILADGNEWIIPLARKLPSGVSTLPTDLIEVRDGEMIEVPMTKYVGLSKIADEIWSDLDKKEDEPFTILNLETGMPAVYKACKEVIQVNYDLEWFEFSALRLINTNNALSILWAVVDFREALYTDEEMTDEKKKDLETSKDSATT